MACFRNRSSAGVIWVSMSRNQAGGSDRVDWIAGEGYKVFLRRLSREVAGKRSRQVDAVRRRGALVRGEVRIGVGF